MFLEIDGRYINKSHIVSMGFVENSSGKMILQIHTTVHNGDSCMAFRMTDKFNQNEFEKQMSYLGVSKITGLEVNL